MDHAVNATRELRWIEGSYAVCRLPARALLRGMPGGPFVSITRTIDELSIVCATGEVPPEAESEGPYALFRVVGSMELGLTGVIAALTAPLATAGIPVFTLATFDTDYVLVREADREHAEQALGDAGYRFVAETG